MIFWVIILWGGITSPFFFGDEAETVDEDETVCKQSVQWVWTASTSFGICCERLNTYWHIPSAKTFIFNHNHWVMGSGIICWEWVNILLEVCLAWPVTVPGTKYVLGVFTTISLFVLFLLIKDFVRMIACMHMLFPFSLSSPLPPPPSHNWPCVENVERGKIYFFC